jgi:hypothetical protein
MTCQACHGAERFTGSDGIFDCESCLGTGVEPERCIECDDYVMPAPGMTCRGCVEQQIEDEQTHCLSLTVRL